MICMGRYARLSVLVFFITSSLYGLSNKSIAAGLVGGACYWWYQHPQELKLDPSEMNIFTLFPSLGAGVESMRSYVKRFRNGDSALSTNLSVSKERSHSAAPKALRIQEGLAPELVASNAIVVYSNGNRRSELSGLEGAGLLSVYVRYRCGIMPYLPTIAFDYPDDKFRHFDLGRVDELVYTCKQLQVIAPDTQQILMGECGGGSRIIKYAIDHPEAPIKALIGFSVMPSFDVCLRGISKTFLQPWGGNYLLRMPFLRSIRSMLFPSYNKEQDQLFNQLNMIKDKDIFLVYHKRDVLIPMDAVCSFVDCLRKNNRVYLVLVDGDEWIPHAAIETYYDSVRKALHAFYKKLDVPHDERLAQEGEPLLRQASWNAQNVSYCLN